MADIAMFFAEGYEEVEALTVIDLLRRAGIETDMVSVTGSLQVTGSHNITVTMDKLLEEADFSDTKMLILPGGMPGTRNLEACEALMGLLDEFNGQGRCISAICAAPSVLGHRGYLAGKKACCYPGFEDHLKGAQVTQKPCEVSGHITTARGMGCAAEFGLAIVERFQGKQAADSLADAVIYKRGSQGAGGGTTD